MATQLHTSFSYSFVAVGTLSAFAANKVWIREYPVFQRKTSAQLEVHKDVVYMNALPHD